MNCTRRDLVGGLMLAGTVGMLGIRPVSAGAEPPPETTKLRLFKWRSLCVTPQFVAEELLKLEGFTEVQYVQTEGGGGAEKALASGEYTLQTLKTIPYAKWREYDPEDTLRFYALRLHEARMIKSTPQKLIAQGSEWRFLDELKKELKG